MEKTKHSDPLDEQSRNILYELLKGDKKISELLPITNDSYHTLRNKISKLEEAELITTETKLRYGDKGPKTIIVKITEKGKLVAEALKKAEWLAKLPPEKIERFARMKAYIHINYYDNHITLKEIALGESHIIDVFIKLRGNVLYLECDYDKTDDCEHIELIFASQELAEHLKEWLNKNGYRLAKKYDKYVERYW